MLTTVFLRRAPNLVHFIPFLQHLSPERPDASPLGRTSFSPDAFQIAVGSIVELDTSKVLALSPLPTGCWLRRLALVLIGRPGPPPRELKKSREEETGDNMQGIESQQNSLFLRNPPAKSNANYLPISRSGPKCSSMHGRAYRCQRRYHLRHHSFWSPWGWWACPAWSMPSPGEDIFIFPSYRLTHFDMHFKGVHGSIVMHTDKEVKSWNDNRNEWDSHIVTVKWINCEHSAPVEDDKGGWMDVLYPFMDYTAYQKSQ